MPTFIRLTDYKSSDAKEAAFFDPANRYQADQNDFEKIPGSPIAYWVNNNLIQAFQNNLLGIKIPVKKGMDTGNNEIFLRYWFEISIKKMGIGFTNPEDFANLQKKMGSLQ
jgi:hypothetical protein